MSFPLKGASVDVLRVDVQVWLGLCGNYTSNYGRIYVVYSPYHGMAVSCCRRFPVEGLVY
jgi:hypothetical protein